MRDWCYFAAPLFSEGERSFNATVATRLEQYVHVYLPQRDGYLLSELLEDGVDIEAAREAVFRADLSAIDQANWIIAVLDGPAVDDGVAVELGYAFARGKLCIGLQTDPRRGPDYFKNPMWNGALSRTFCNVDDLLAWVHDRQSVSETEQPAAIRTSPATPRLPAHDSDC